MVATHDPNKMLDEASAEIDRLTVRLVHLQEMAEDLWKELQYWHTPKCAKFRLGIIGAECVCHRILETKWNELTRAAEYAAGVQP